jgi:hypothetical protein
MRFPSRPTILCAAAILIAVFCGSGGAQPVSSSKGIVLKPRVVDIRSFGAAGDGRTDDTTAIQAAIDYGYANHIQGIVCPSGSYVTSRTIYLDAPNNLRANFASPPLFSFSLAFVGEDQGIGNGDGFGCTLRPNFNDKVAFLVGPGQHMKVSGIAVIGPSGGYRGNQNVNGVGIGIAGGGGGAHHTILENTWVENFYTLYKTDANGACCLSDSNYFNSVSGINGYIGIDIAGSQSYINKIEEPILAATIAFNNATAKNVTISGGNPSATSGKSAKFGISGVSSLSQAADGGFSFTATIASPDAFWCNVYNSFAVVTAHFGVVPLRCTNWNGGTITATLQTTVAWTTANFGRIALHNSGNSDLTAELQAVTSIYAAERLTIANGMGISLEGTHIENATGCTTLYDMSGFTFGMTAASVKNVLFNYDPALTVYAPSNGPTDVQLALFYCQQTFPLVVKELDDGEFGSLSLENIEFAQSDYISGGTPSAPLLFQLFPANGGVSAKNLRSIAPFNLQVYDVNWYSYAEIGAFGQIDTVPGGAGDWDNGGAYFMPHGISDLGGCSSSHPVACYIAAGHLTTPWHGYRPAQGQIPNLSPDIYALVSGALGSLGSYPPIDSETIYRSVVLNLGTLTSHFLRSHHEPGWSWGQDLNDTSVGETVTWSYKGQSAMLYLSAKTLSWIFPGLSFQLSGGMGDGSAGADHYIVTGVYPQLGYITAIDVTVKASGNPNAVGAPLPGASTTVYSCSSSCAIKQAPYRWRSY